MKSLLKNKKVKIILVIALILIIALLLIGIVINKINDIKKAQEPKLQSRERIEQVLEITKDDKQNNENYNSEEYLTNLLKNNNIIVNGNIVSINGYNFEIDRENLNISNELGSTNVDISSEVVGTTGKDENGRDLGKVALNLTSNITIDKVILENIDGSITQENVNSTTYRKEMDVVFGHTHTISVVTSDGKIKMHKINKEKPIPPISEPSTASGIRTGNKLNFTWAEIAEIAKLISDDSSITRDTQEFKLAYKGNNYIIGVGDYTYINTFNKVRIIGFNHDTLTNKNAYGGNNTYAGITFEFERYVIQKGSMNSSNSNSGGWGACTLRNTLNNTTINKYEIKNYIKQVNKKYIKSGSTTAISSDYVWLMSFAEIWSSGTGTGTICISVRDGETYKYYKNINANSKNGNDWLIKEYGSIAQTWWLRSPMQYGSGQSFIVVDYTGSASGYVANYTALVSPGFCI